MRSELAALNGRVDVGRGFDADKVRLGWYLVGVVPPNSCPSLAPSQLSSGKHKADKNRRACQVGDRHGGFIPRRDLGSRDTFIKSGVVDSQSTGRDAWRDVPTYK